MRNQTANLFGFPSDQGAEFSLAIDPLADLLFSLVAIVVMAVIVILPSVRAMSTNSPRSTTDLRTYAALQLNGHTIEPFVATQSGLGIGSEIIPLDRILEDQRLIRKLKGMRRTDEPLLLLIEPSGLEAAFLFDTVASLYGPARIRQIRLDAACTQTKSARAAQWCGGMLEPSDGPRP